MTASGFFTEWISARVRTVRFSIQCRGFPNFIGSAIHRDFAGIAIPRRSAADAAPSEIPWA